VVAPAPFQNRQEIVFRWLMPTQMVRWILMIVGTDDVVVVAGGRCRPYLLDCCSRRPQSSGNVLLRQCTRKLVLVSECRYLSFFSSSTCPNNVPWSNVHCSLASQTGETTTNMGLDAFFIELIPLLRFHGSCSSTYLPC